MNKKITISVIVLVVLALGFFMLSKSPKTSDNLDGSKNDTKSEDIKQPVATNVFENYTDNDLGLKFQYPKSFSKSKIVIDEKNDDCKKGKSKSIIFKNEKITVGAFSNNFKFPCDMGLGSYDGNVNLKDACEKEGEIIGNFKSIIQYGISTNIGYCSYQKNGIYTETGVEYLPDETGVVIHRYALINLSSKEFKGLIISKELPSENLNTAFFKIITEEDRNNFKTLASEYVAKIQNNEIEQKSLNEFDNLVASIIEIN